MQKIAGNVLQTDLKQGLAGLAQKLHNHKEQVGKQTGYSSDRITIDAEQNTQACAAGVNLWLILSCEPGAEVLLSASALFNLQWLQSPGGLAIALHQSQRNRVSLILLHPE